MSFHSYTTNPLSKKDTTSSRNNHHAAYPSIYERTFLPSFAGSLTIEAALALPIFIFFCVCIVHFLILLFLQADIQTHLDEAARDIGKYVYAASDSEIASYAVANSVAIRSKVLDDSLTEKLNNSRVRNGADGLSFVLSIYDSESGALDVIVTYTYDFPYLPEGIASPIFRQQCCCRAWIGMELSEDSVGSKSDEESSESQTVYITPEGSAYHLTPTCSYLDLSIVTVSRSGVSALRNASGHKYTKCSCVQSGAENVYITSYGTQYHSSLTCSDLKRTVYAVDISEVGGRHPCSKCAAASGQ